MSQVSVEFYIKNKSTGATLYNVTAMRNMVNYPYTEAGNNAFRDAVTNGLVERVTSEGCKIPVGQKAPLAKPTCVVTSGPTWASSSYDYNGTLLTIRATGDDMLLRFEREDGQPIALRNPDDIKIDNVQFFEHATNGNVYSWQVNFPSAPSLKLTYKRKSDSTTYSKTFTPTVGASNVTLFSTGTVTPTNPDNPTTPTDPDNPTPDYPSPTIDFDFKPLPSKEWPLYRSTPYRDIYERNPTVPIGKVARLKNEYIMIEIWESFGGTIAWISRGGDVNPDDYTENLINNPDRGRNYGITLYGGPVPTSIPNWSVQNGAWKDFRWDPISAGDSFNNGTPVVAFGYTDNMLYVKRNCLDWSLRNVTTDLFIEEWIQLNGRAVESFVKITNARSDKTFYDNSSHEFPQMMINGGRSKMALYNGDKPFTKDAHREFYLRGDVNGETKSFHMAPALQSENWSAIKAHNDTKDWIGLVTPISFANNADSIGFNDNAAYTFMDPMTVQRCTQPRVLDAPGVIYHRHSAVLGTIDQIRTYAYAMPKPSGYVGKPHFVFDKAHGRCDWVVEKATDAKEPFPNDYWDVNLGIAPDLKSDFSPKSAAITTPYVAWNPALFNKIYVRMAYTGARSQLRFTWMQNAQYDAFFSPNSPQEERDNRFYNGELPRVIDEQTVFFNVNGDGQWRTYVIDLAGKDRWSKCIQRATIGYHYNWNDVVKGENLKIAWISADPNGANPN